ncbi:MAG: endopeptidase La [Pseudomonadota bacterium]
MTEQLPQNKLQLPVVPLRNIVLFPGVVMPVDVGRSKSLAISEKASREPGFRVALVTQVVPELEEPGLADLYSMGVEGEVLRVMTVAPNRATIVIRGIRRIKLLGLEDTDDYVIGSFEVIEDKGAKEVEAQGLAMAIRDSAKELASVAPDVPDEMAAMLEQVRDPGQLADIAVANLDLSIAEKIELLNMTDVSERAREALAKVQRALETFRVKEHIDSHVRAEMGKHQREAMLRQRMRAIQEELGDGDEDDVAAEFEERIQEANMPKETEDIAKKQLVRLRQIPMQSPEHTVTRTYLEWLVDLPWNNLSKDELDLDRARTILDEDHYGLAKVKKRIVEYLAVRKLKPDKKGPILCLVGPPGVGKTSTGRSVARALGRKFVRASLGGVRDEAEIRGHRRTYVGALPGRILQAIRHAGTRNPVFVLDEIDKLGKDFRGDPSSALLEVLDPEQNNTFSDHFLEVPFDLSSVVFFATANEIDPIPPALKDRLEILELPGYTRNEKLHIAKRHLIPKQILDHGLSEDQVPIKDAGIVQIMDSYTREAGVRNLERELAGVCRSVAVRVAANKPLLKNIELKEIGEILGPVKFYPEMAERTEIPGVATGLCWTPVGGEILFIEATRMPGKGKLILTGQLGEVMQESAQAALTFARSRAESLGLEADFFSQTDLHVHVPAGAIRKDGPSAGLTIVTALVSLLSRRCCHDNLAMTGEISLRGTVMPVGGIKEKVLAAHRAGLRLVLLPEKNKKDLVDVPQDVQEEMELVFVDTIQQVLDIALEPVPKPRRALHSHNPAPGPDATHSVI